jgi:hypothetical protein
MRRIDVLTLFLLAFQEEICLKKRTGGLEKNAVFVKSVIKRIQLLAEQ